jgi:hypothetical protein
MPPAHAILPTFGGGEIAPALQARTDLAKYQSALKRARNMLIAPQGGAYNRAGFKYIATAKDSAHPVRTISFEFSTAQAYTLELGHLYARFYTNGGQVQTSATAAWLTTTAYAVGALVKNGGHIYYCVAAHTSGTFATDLAAGLWYLLADNGIGEAIYEIPTPWAGDDLLALKFAQNNDVLFVCHSSYAPQTLTRFGSTNWQITPYAFINGPFMLDNNIQANTLKAAVQQWMTATNYVVGDTVYNTTSRYECLISHTSGVLATDLAAGKWAQYALVSGVYGTAYPIYGGGISLISSIAQFVSGHVGSFWKVETLVPTGQLTSNYSITTDTQAILCGSAWRLVTSGTWTGSVSVQVSGDNGQTWNTIRTVTSFGSSNYDLSGDTGISQGLMRLHTNLNAGPVNVNLTSDSFTWVGIAKITRVVSGTLAIAAVQTPAGMAPGGFDAVLGGVHYADFSSAKSSGDTTSPGQFSWAEGAWSTYRGWPGACAFFQDRFFLGNSPSQPETLWGSRASSYYDHGVSDQIVDSDSININLPSQKLNAIQSLTVLRDLLALTSSTDWGVQSASGVVTPTTVQPVPQGQRGAAAIQPIVAGLRAIIVQPMGTVVRDLGFSIYTNSYDGNNLSLIASHLFTGFTIADACYQQEPDSLVWFVRSDGLLISLTYLFEQEVVAWTWHDTAGKVESVCSIPAPGGGYNQLWAVVNRSGTRFIELMDQRMASSDPADQFFVDAGLKLDVPVAITAITAANPVVVTAAGHGFNNGDVVDIDATVVGMDAWTDADGQAVVTPSAGEDTSLLLYKTIAANGYKVANKTADTFELQDSNGNAIDGTGLSSYVSGGKVRKQVSVVTGLNHLEGKKVAVLANGFVQSQKTVASGSITLDAAASRVVVGLPYTADLETLSFEQPQQDGTLQGRKVKMAELTMRLLNTAGGQVMQGEDVRMLDPIFPNNPPVGGKPNALFSGDLPKVQIRGGYDYGAHIWIRQSDPLPIQVLGLMPMVVAGR